MSAQASYCYCGKHHDVHPPVDTSTLDGVLTEAGYSPEGRAFIVQACNAHAELTHALKWLLAAIDGDMKADMPGRVEYARAALAKVEQK